MKKRIAIITPGGLPVPAVKGGAVQNLIEYLVEGNEKEQIYEMTVICPYDVEAKKKAEMAYEKTKFAWIQIPRFVSILDNITYRAVKLVAKKTKAISFRNNFKFMYYSLWMGKFLKDNAFDVVVIENNVRLFWAIKIFGNTRRYSGKIYYHLHNIPRTPGGCKKQIQSCKGVLCVSSFVKQSICSPSSRVGQYDPAKVDILLNCIDTERFRPINNCGELDQWNNKYGINNEDNVIICSGRMSPEKGILETIQAIELLKTKNIKLLVVGADFYGMGTSSPFEERLRAEAERIRDKVLFTGFVDYNEMHNIYNLGKIAVLPSIWDEPAGLTMIEAMACGLPVITTDAGGIPEYSDNSSIMLKRDERLVENIAEEIDKLFSDEEYYRFYSQKGRERAVLFDKANYLDALASIIDS